MSLKPVTLPEQLNPKVDTNIVRPPKVVDSISRNFGLDLARTVAISLVLASHFSHKALDSLGFWGVELFFALSGFLIGNILWRNFSRTETWTKAKAINFWQRRWWRTLPNYYLFFALLLLIGFLNSEEIPSINNLSKFIWFGQNLFDHSWEFYGVSWSLCIEEWFYLLFPLLLLAIGSFIRNRNAAFSVALVFIFLGSIISRSVLLNHNPLSYLRGITFARLDAIAYGVLVSFVLLVYKITTRQKVVALIIGTTFQFWAVVYAYKVGLAYIAVSQLFLIIVPLGFALIIPYISLLKIFDKRYYSIKNSIGKISLWSYSIYLSHGPIMWLSYSLLKEYRNNFYGNLASKVIGLLVTIAISAMLYHFFEVPLTKKRPKELKG